MKAIFCAMLFAAFSKAEVKHTSLTNNLRVSKFAKFNFIQIPRGSFAHFRLVGSGTDDQNIDADITSVGYQLNIQSIKYGSIHNKFDIYLFAGNDADYNCFVMGAQLWTDYGVKQSCDFLTMRPSVVKSAITEYSEDSATFLDHMSKTNEVFVVVDNSGWYYAINN